MIFFLLFSLNNHLNPLLQLLIWHRYKKINSYSHTEHNIPKNNDNKYIEDCINNEVNFLDKDDILKVETNLEKLPKYVKNNIKKYDEWIIKK